MTENTNISETIKCVVCLMPMIDVEIRMCIEGHNTCARCFQQLQWPPTCPTCRIPMLGEGGRNRTLENVIRVVNSRRRQRQQQRQPLQQPLRRSARLSRQPPQLQQQPQHPQQPQQQQPNALANAIANVIANEDDQMQIFNELRHEAKNIRTQILVINALTQKMMIQRTQFYRKCPPHVLLHLYQIATRAGVPPPILPNI